MASLSKKINTGVKFVFVSFLLVMTLQHTAFAQAKKQVRKIPDAIKQLEFLMGKWEGKVASETGPVVTNKEYSATYEFSKVLNGAAIKVSATHKEVKPDSSFESSGIIGYDTSSKQLHIFLVNDAGETYDLKGNWTNMTTLNFTYEGVRNAKKMLVNMWLSKMDGNKIEIKTYTTIGEELLITDDAILNKVVAPKTDHK